MSEYELVEQALRAVYLPFVGWGSVLTVALSLFLGILVVFTSFLRR